MTIRALQYAIQHLIDEKGVPDTAIVVARDNSLYAEWDEKTEDGKKERESMQIYGYVPTKGKKDELFVDCQMVLDVLKDFHAGRPCDGRCEELMMTLERKINEINS